MEFTCETSLENVLLVWKPTTLHDYADSYTQPGGGKLSVLRFNATANWNNTQVTCTVLDGTSYRPLESSSATLLVQGECFSMYVPVN